MNQRIFQILLSHGFERFIHSDVLEPGVARISGMVLAPDDQTRITEIVESVAGISSVQSKVVPMPMGYA
jgi:hypothetical protein